MIQLDYSKLTATPVATDPFPHIAGARLRATREPRCCRRRASSNTESSTRRIAGAFRFGSRDHSDLEHPGIVPVYGGSYPMVGPTTPCVSSVAIRCRKPSPTSTASHRDGTTP